MLKDPADRAAERQRRLDRLKIDMDDLISKGGAAPFIREYLDFLSELKSSKQRDQVMMEKGVLTGLGDDGRPVIIQKFPRQKVQLAAITFAEELSKLNQADPNDNYKIFLKMAEVAYISAAGHYKDDKNVCMPEFSIEANSRRIDAENQWSNHVTENLPVIGDYSVSKIIDYIISPEKEFTYLYSLYNVLSAIFRTLSLNFRI